jgi:hypothetical protein
MRPESEAAGVTETWEWVGGALPAAVGDPVGRKSYAAVEKVMVDGSGGVRARLRVNLGDIVTMEPADEGDSAPWVAQCIVLCELGEGESIDGEADDAVSEAGDETKRVGIRWLYRGQDIPEENEEEDVRLSPPMHARELCMTDFINGPEVNAVTVISHVARLVSSASECQGNDVAYFCRRFFYSKQAAGIVEPSVMPQHLVGKRERKIEPYELKLLLSKPDARPNKFWHVRRRIAPKKGVGRAKVKSDDAIVSEGAEGLAADARARREAEGKKDVSDMTLDSLLPADQMEAVRKRMRELTAEQTSALLNELPNFVSEVTRQLAATEVKRQYSEYESDREAMVDNASRTFWEHFMERSVKAARVLR